MKEKSKKRCYGCADFNCYYTRGTVKFNKEKVGYCRDHQKITDASDTCDKWRSNNNRRQLLSMVSVRSLNETIESLRMLADIVTEDVEKKHIYYLARERLMKKLKAIEEELDGKSVIDT